MENQVNATISWMPVRRGGGMLCQCPGGVIYMDADGTFCWSGEVIPGAVTGLYGACETIWESSGKPKSREICSTGLLVTSPEEEEGEKAIIALLRGWRRRIERSGS